MTEPAFNITSALATVVCALVVIALCAAGKLKDFSMPVIPAAVVLLCGMVATGIDEALLPFEGAHLAFSVVAFAVGSIMLKMAWIELFAHEAPRQAIIQISCAGLASAGLQYVLSFAGTLQNVVLTVILLVLSTAILIGVRQKMACGQTHAPHRVRSLDAKDSRRAAFDEISDALLALCVLEAVIGLINSFMLAASMTFAGAASVPSLAMAIAAALFCFAALITRRIPAASETFRMAFPVLAAMVVFVPFASEGYSRLFSTVLLVGYDFVALLLLYQVAYASHKFGVSSYALMALFAGCTKLCLLAALVIGGIFGGQESEGASSTVRFLVLSCAVIYLLAITLTLLSRDRKKRAQRRRERGERGLARLHDESAHAPSEPSDEPQGESVRTASNGEPEQDDACKENLANAEQADESKATKEGKNGASSEDESFEAICQELSELHGLTGREMEILGHLARGRTNTRIAEDLFISPSTVRGHIRHIYTKLDVHDRQELIDLFH
ncbi:MAG: helix-turn-helix transcriptional regulator [Slackia sp.]|nr:helix-turn-helix transcriptional regulator [Slackia sp.]